MSTKDAKLASRLVEGGVTALCFNSTRTKVCYATSNHELLIASVVGTDASSWKTEFRSVMHELTITYIDWCRANNCILSCGHDRIAYVWTESSKKPGTWDPEMVTLATESNRGAISCGWSPSGKRFAVCSTTNVPSVCLRDTSDGNTWWISSPLKNHALASVTSLAFCPTEDALLATGSADGHVRFVSTFLKAVDEGDVKDRLGKAGVILCDQPISGVWVNSLAWNPAGTALLAVTQDSSVSLFARAAEGSVTFSATLRLRFLPMRSVAFVGDSQAVSAGGDMFPILLSVDSSGKTLKYSGKWSASNLPTNTTKSSASLAMAKFQNEASLGQATKVDTSAMRHLVDIGHVAAIKMGDGQSFSFATTGMDGRVEIWTGAQMEKA